MLLLKICALCFLCGLIGAVFCSLVALKVRDDTLKNGGGTMKNNRVKERSRSKPHRGNVVTLTVRCASCKKTRDIQPGEIAGDDFPMCDVCGMPMLPVKASVKKRGG